MAEVEWLVISAAPRRNPGYGRQDGADRRALPGLAGEPHGPPPAEATRRSVAKAARKVNTWQTGHDIPFTGYEMT
jgi:hypothetical protein